MRRVVAVMAVACVAALTLEIGPDEANAQSGGGSLEAAGMCACPPSPWGLGWYTQPNPDGPVGNPTMSLGYNTDAAGNPSDPSLPTIYQTWEGNWDQVHAAPWVELHWQYRGTDGTFRRPLTLAVPTDTHAPHLAVAGKFTVADRTHTTTRLNILDSPAGQPSAVMFGTASVPTYLRCNGQAAGCLQQLSADGTAYVQLVYLDHLNRLSVGVGADGLRFYADDKPEISGSTTAAQLDSLIAALVTLGLVTDGRP